MRENWGTAGERRVPELTAAAGELVLRPWSMSSADSELVREAADDDLIPLITSVPSVYSAEEATRFIERQWERVSSGSGYPFVIERAVDGKPLGGIGVWVRDLREGRASIGYWLVRSARGQGIAAHALRTVTAWSFEQLCAPRLQLYVEPWNTASVRTAERAGFRREGLLRGWQQVGESRRDMYMYARLAPTRSKSPRSLCGAPIVRAAIPADVDGIVQLRVAVAAEGKWIGAEAPFDTEDAARHVRSNLGDDGCGVFVAEIDGSLAGTATVYFTTPGVTVFAMMVATGRRGRGIGTALLDRVIGWSRDQGAHKVTLQVWPHNQPAMALYDRAGFEVEGVLRGHYRRRGGELWDAVLMGLPLDDAV
ncbi:N-acetyltransferase [Streptomyces gardneri]|uniref:GNAT family N-acetyltransferase n=1 Tax=Nocardia sputi TaxID=2943705 RepID=UPI001894B7EE|nr:GNAT family N-acetyltransferase [Nocardia sputi]MBF6163780.1 N-acetyltransferase [Streptomyces gardneri]